MGQSEKNSVPLPSSAGEPLQDLPNPIASLKKTYPDGYLSSRHTHVRHQVIYSVSGLMMAETDGIRWAVPPGYGLIVPSGTPHQTRMIGGVNLQSLYLRPDLDTTNALTEPRIVAISPLLTLLIAEFCNLENPWPMPPKADHLLHLILIELAEAPTSSLALPYPVDKRLQRVCDALLAQPATDKGIDGWADEARMSRRSFTRKFHRQTGLSVGQWVQRLRCHLALQAMANGIPMAKTARELGYASAYSLQAMMRRVV